MAVLLIIAVQDVRFLSKIQGVKSSFSAEFVVIATITDFSGKVHG
jgi:hypothetical protein